MSKDRRAGTEQIRKTHWEHIRSDYTEHYRLWGWPTFILDKIRSLIGEQYVITEDMSVTGVIEGEEAKMVRPVEKPFHNPSKNESALDCTG